jgi:hypothetical protein
MSGSTPSQRLPRCIPVSLHAPLGWGGWTRLGRLGQLQLDSCNWTCTSRLKKRWEVKTPPRLLPFLLLPPRRRQGWQETSRQRQVGTVHVRLQWGLGWPRAQEPPRRGRRRWAASFARTC